jgi:predicted O-linked N-acetylglucosamine transferase (SPINDLY family)
MKPVWGVINHHDRSRFEIHLFSGGEIPGLDSGYAGNPLDILHDVRGLSNDDLAARTSSLNIDVLIDLNGYSSQSRLGFLMRRPAPVIIGWFNIYATTGIDAYDYIVGDSVVIPPAEEQFYCERILRVPGSYLAFSVPYPVPDVMPPPRVSAGHITFGCLCSQYKITDPVVAAWATILRAAPDVKLLLKNAALGNATNQTALLERFARHEIAPDRLLLEGPAPHMEFLKAYNRVDIALDTSPYNGGTTTMEALWQGVPVLSFNGDRWAGRQSCSLLLAAGLDKWCTPDLDSYIECAVNLARSPNTPAELVSLRAMMRARLQSSSACNSAGMCHALETIYLDVSQQRVPLP